MGISFRQTVPALWLTVYALFAALSTTPSLWSLGFLFVGLDAFVRSFDYTDQPSYQSTQQLLSRCANTLAPAAFALSCATKLAFPWLGSVGQATALKDAVMAFAILCATFSVAASHGKIFANMIQVPAMLAIVAMGCTGDSPVHVNIWLSGVMMWAAYVADWAATGSLRELGTAASRIFGAVVLLRVALA